MDTGKKLWKVQFKDVAVCFNIIARDASQAEEHGRRCLRNLSSEGGTPTYWTKARVRQAQVTSIRFEGTLDEPSRRRKAART